MKRLVVSATAALSLLVVAPGRAAPPPSGRDARPADGAATSKTTTPASAPTKADRGTAVLKTVRFPGGEIAVPVAWSPKVRNEPPIVEVNVTPAPNMTCDLGIIEGRGNVEEAERYLAAGARSYDGETARASPIRVGGHVLQGIRVTRPKAFLDNPEALVEVYVALSGDDLVGIGVTRFEQTPASEDGRRRCLQAFAGLLAKLPPPNAP